VRGRVVLFLGCALFAAVAGLWNIQSSPDTQYDEVVYTRAAQEVARGWHLTWTNEPMFVHPPLSFLAQAGWLHLLGRDSVALVDAIASARVLAGTAAVTAVLFLVLLASHLMPQATGRHKTFLLVVITALAATDPVLLRYGRLAMIEPFALLGCLVTLYLARALRKQPAVRFVPAVGLATGLTLLTKEITMFVLLTPVVHALLSRDWHGSRKAACAVLIGLTFWLLFPLWAVQLGLLSTFIDVKGLTFERLVGFVQTTGWNQPDKSFFSAIGDQVSQYASSYLILGGGALAVLWLLLHRLTDSARWLLAWLITSYAFGAYIVLLGTLNEQFFVYVIPAAVVGTVLVADAVLAGRISTLAAEESPRASRQLMATALVPVIALCGIVGFAVIAWARFYVTDNDGVFRSVAFIRGHLPACSAVNATGDVEKYAYLLPGYNVTEYATGPGAASHGVHLFFLSDKDVANRYGNATPELSSWVRAHGTKLASFPSTTYRGLELWQVPPDRYNPLAGVETISGGEFAITQGSRCGGFAVVNGQSGDLATGWATVGGKAFTGPPVTASWTVGDRSYQVFDGAALSVGSDPAISALPIVRQLAAAAPQAYREAQLPPVTEPLGGGALSDAELRSRLTDPAIAATYLDTAAGTLRALLGDPIGPAVLMPDGKVRQAFAGAVLEHAASATQVRLAPLGALAIEAHVVLPPGDALRPAVPPSLTADLGPPLPTTVEPFVKSLGAAVAVYALVTTVVIQLHQRRRHPPEAADDR